MATTLAALAPDLLQGVGMLIVTVSAWRTRRRLSAEKFSWDGMSSFVEQLRNAVSGQFRDQAIGFSLFLLGLVWKLLAQ